MSNRLVFVCLCACGTPSSTTTTTAAAVTGHFYYTFNDEVFRVEAKAGATIENVSTQLDAKFGASADSEKRINASVNGEWMVLEASRFGCTGCLVRVNKALSAGERVAPAGEEVYLEGLAAIDATGNVVVYAASGPSHNYDLFKTTRAADGTWSAPVNLTAASTYAYNNMPSLSFDGALVTFDCGEERDPESGNNAACSVAIAGGAVTVLATASLLAGSENTYVQNPHAGVDGVIFESAWPIGSDTPETVWLLAPGSKTPTPIGASLSNAVSPCTLRDGRFGVLWLGSPNNSAGRHELSIVDRDGKNPVSLTPGIDVVDAGIGCSD